MKESLENELDSDDEPLSLRLSKANYHVVESPTIKKKTLEGDSSKADKEVKGKGKEKDKRKEKGKCKRKSTRKIKIKRN